ncbi:MAG: hypothetical protein PWP34_2593 [Desulfuromonadales bacterium]|jgi:hypothetical protein|nr:hypothetical protein [Desulfuromonadales bacterium]
MPVSVFRVVREIREYIVGQGEDWENWYIGITVDPSDRLCDDHLIRFGHDRWFCREAFTPEEAQEARDKLVADYAVDGDEARDEKTGRFVYAYRKAPHTKP